VPKPSDIEQARAAGRGLAADRGPITDPTIIRKVAALIRHARSAPAHHPRREPTFVVVEPNSLRDPDPTEVQR
jgi:hypothetical protein